MQVSLGRSVGMGLLRAPVMPKQAFLASETDLGPCRCNVAEILVFDPSSQQSPSIINRKKRIEKKGGNQQPAANPQTRNFRQCGRVQLAFLRALRLAPQSTKSQQKKSHVHSGIRTRNRQYA